MIKQRRFSRDFALGRDSEIGAYPLFSTGLSRNYSRFVGNPEVITGTVYPHRNSVAAAKQFTPPTPQLPGDAYFRSDCVRIPRRRNRDTGGTNAKRESNQE